jgi:hypothetical protein
VADLGKSFACVLAWGRQSSALMSKEELGRLLETLAAQASPDDGIYLAVDGLSPSHLDAVRLLFPFATAFEVCVCVRRGGAGGGL